MSVCNTHFSFAMRSFRIFCFESILLNSFALPTKTEVKTVVFQPPTPLTPTFFGVTQLQKYSRQLSETYYSDRKLIVLASDLRLFIISANPKFLTNFKWEIFDSGFLILGVLYLKWHFSRCKWFAFQWTVFLSEGCSVSTIFPLSAIPCGDETGKKLFLNIFSSI